VAIKFKHVLIDPSLFREETEIYKSLTGDAGISAVYWFGWECEYRAMVFELLGPSLKDFFNYCGRHFSFKTVLMIADQLICRLQYIHSKNMIHRNIKPENFLMEMGRNGNCIYVTDLGLVTEYRPNRAPQSVLSNPHLFGTAVFASVTGHFGMGEFPCRFGLFMADREAEQSRRDNLESLEYILLYFFRGSLPWQKLEAETKRKNISR
jgi:casein kinase I family protein HRR25